MVTQSVHQKQLSLRVSAAPAGRSGSSMPSLGKILTPFIVFDTNQPRFKLVNMVRCHNRHLSMSIVPRWTLR